MTRRRRAPNRLAAMTDEDRAKFVLADVLDPVVGPILKAEVDELGKTPAFSLWLDLLPRLGDDPDLNAAINELCGIKATATRGYDPNCFENPSCDCSACAEMRRIEAAELKSERST